MRKKSLKQRKAWRDTSVTVWRHFRSCKSKENKFMKHNTHFLFGHFCFFVILFLHFIWSCVFQLFFFIAFCVFLYFLFSCFFLFYFMFLYELSVCNFGFFHILFVYDEVKKAAILFANASCKCKFGLFLYMYFKKKK